MDKIIFLDIDGVLNIMSKSYNSCHYKNLGGDAIEKHLMQRLEYIIENTGAYIVVSSAWHVTSVTRLLSGLDFEYIDNILGETSRKHTLRGDQIAQYIREYEVENYVVLEDEISDVCGDKCNAISNERVVEVDMAQGLSQANVVEAISILGEKSYDDVDDEYICIWRGKEYTDWSKLLFALKCDSDFGISGVTSAVENIDALLDFKLLYYSEDARFLGIKVTRKERE